MGIDPGDSRGRAGRCREVHTNLDYNDDQGINELLKESRLFDADRFYYTAIPPALAAFTREHGTYLHAEGKPANQLFCCAITVDGDGEVIRQIGAAGHRTLRDYLNQNGDLDTAVIAVYDQRALVQVSGPEFAFKEPENARRALVALVYIDNFGRV